MREVHNVISADFRVTFGGIRFLPVGPKLVDEAVVHIEEGITGAGDRIGHLSH